MFYKKMLENRDDKYETMPEKKIRMITGRLTGAKIQDRNIITKEWKEK